MAETTDDLLGPLEGDVETTPVPLLPGASGEQFPDVPVISPSPRAVAAARNPGVDLDRGLSSSQRFSIALRRGENLNRFLDEQFGPGGYRFNDDGQMVILGEGNQEFLADEFGFGVRDLVDLSDMVAPAAGGIAATLAAPATAGAAFLAALGAGGAFAGGGLVDLMTTVGPVDFNRAIEIAEERGPEAGLDFVLGLGGGRLVETMRTRARAGEDALSPTNVEAAARRLRERTGFKIPLSAAQVTGNPSLARLESIGLKLPLSAEAFKRQIREQEGDLLRIERGLTDDVDVGQVGERLSSELTEQSARAEDAIRAANQGLDDTINRRLDEIGDVLSPGGANLTLDEGAAVIRSRWRVRRDGFLSTVKSNYAQFRGAPGGEDVIVSPSGPAGVASAIEKDIAQELRVTKTPGLDEGQVALGIEGNAAKEVVTSGPAKAFFPASARRAVDSIKNLDVMTVDQARRARTTINEAIAEGEALPGFQTRELRRLSNSFTVAIEDAVAAIPDPTARRLLASANKHYRENFEQFLEKDVSGMLLDPSDKGFRDTSEIVNEVLFSGKRGSGERVARLMAAIPAHEQRLVARSVWNSIVTESRSNLLLAEGFVDAKILNNRLGQIPDSVLERLFSGQGEELREVVQAAAVRNGTLDLSRMADLRGDLVGAVRTAARGAQLQREVFQRDVIKPFLKNEVGESAIQPDKLTAHLLDSTPEQVGEFMSQLAPDSALRAEVERATIDTMLRRGTRPADQNDIISGLVSEGKPIIGGKAMLDQLRDLGGAKLSHLVSPQAQGVLRDIAIIRGGRENLRQAGGAGGLIAGSAIATLMSGSFVALPLLIQYNVLSRLLTNPAIVNRLRSRRLVLERQATSGERKTGIMAGVLSNDIEEEFKDEPRLADEIKVMLGEALVLPELMSRETTDDLLGPITQAQ